MRRLFIFGLLVGFAGTLAAAHFVPWVSHTRLPSRTSVVANGGRAERFVIRLPADRIQTLEDDAGDPPPLLEHFKVRDLDGNVIGVAARHWSVQRDSPTTTWALVFPSRGSVVLAHEGETSGAVDAALRTKGYTAGAEWNGELRLVRVGDGDATRTVVGSDEFVGLDVSYTETWNITGVDANGDIRGTIELDTVSQRGG
jgi:hypothetical protein